MGFASLYPSYGLRSHAVCAAAPGFAIAAPGLRCRVRGGPGFRYRCTRATDTHPAGGGVKRGLQRSAGATCPGGRGAGGGGRCAEMCRGLQETASCAGRVARRRRLGAMLSALRTPRRVENGHRRLGSEPGIRPGGPKSVKPALQSRCPVGGRIRDSSMPASELRVLARDLLKSKHCCPNGQTG